MIYLFYNSVIYFTIQLNDFIIQVSFQFFQRVIFDKLLGQKQEEQQQQQQQKCQQRLPRTKVSFSLPGNINDTLYQATQIKVYILAASYQHGGCQATQIKRLHILPAWWLPGNIDKKFTSNQRGDCQAIQIKSLHLTGMVVARQHR